MTRRYLRKAAAWLMAAVLCSGLAVPPVSAAVPDTDIAVPQNIAITAVDSRLTQVTTDSLKCYGKTSVQSGYTAGVKVELQMNSGGWYTMKTWNAKGGTSATVNETVDVSTGYSYRLKVTHTAYNSSGTAVETDTTYSSTVNC